MYCRIFLNNTNVPAAH